MLFTSLTHWLSQPVLQQYGSALQICATQGSHDELSLAPVTHLLWTQPVVLQVTPQMLFTSPTQTLSHLVLQQ